MRGWQSHEPGIANLRLGSVEPPGPGPGQALISVEAAALNFSDLLMIDDRYQLRPPRPFVPGQEVAGTVVAAGEGSRLEVGDRVASKVLWGGFAERAVVRDDMSIPVPAGLPSERAAAIPIAFTTAVVSLTESTELRPGETVLVHAAAGGVGLATVQVAKAAGARVIATAGSEAKRALARSYGADEAIDYRDAGWVAAVEEAPSGRGVDVVVDSVGGDTTRQSLRVLAYGGRLLIVGFTSGEIPAIPANRLLLSRASAIGVYWDHDRDHRMLERATRRLTDLLERGRIVPHVEVRHGLRSLPEALADLAGRRTSGKVVLTVNGTEEGA